MNLKKKLNEMQKRPPHFISGIKKQKGPRLWGPFEKS
jgi:hypothetical protein